VTDEQRGLREKRITDCTSPSCFAHKDRISRYRGGREQRWGPFSSGSRVLARVSVLIEPTVAECDCLMISFIM